MTPQELRALALYTQLASLSPDDGEVDARITIRLGDGQFMGDVLLSARDMEAVTDALASVNAYARAERGDETDEMTAVGGLMAEADIPELNPVALAQLQELDVTDLGEQDGGA
ncbi:hypothetical protein ACH4TX_41710 [Streptomyces sp. NPDC021098]|uniref:hypothetical protein n=1 Tax=unclassified Streptomyces TaxID=2593676 RepID=UPI0037969602